MYVRFSSVGGGAGPSGMAVSAGDTSSQVGDSCAGEGPPSSVRCHLSSVTVRSFISPFSSKQVINTILLFIYFR